MMRFPFFIGRVEQKTVGGGEVDEQWTKQTKEDERNV